LVGLTVELLKKRRRRRRGKKMLHGKIFFSLLGFFASN
jgi:hypothetical protein